MPKYFFAPEARRDSEITVSGETAHHLLHVLRTKPGDCVTLCDGMGNDFHCVLTEAVRGAGPAAVFRVESAAPCQSEPLLWLVLYQAMPKGDKMDLIVQKCVELGACEIVPFYARHSVARAADPEKKAARYRRISESAAGQSGRGIIPAVRLPCTFEDTLKGAADDGTLRIFACERLALSAAPPAHGTKPDANFGGEKNHTLHSILGEKACGKIGLWIGPEGGFSPGETDALCGAGAARVTLGPRILRTETAAIAAVAQTICLWEALKN